MAGGERHWRLPWARQYFCNYWQRLSLNRILMSEVDLLVPRKSHVSDDR